MERNKAADYVSFLKMVNRKRPKGKTLYIIADNYSAHKTKEVREYLDSMNGCFVEYFILMHSSWLGLVERWFGEITNKRISRDGWTSVDELEKAIGDFTKNLNASGCRLKWVKSADKIMDSIAVASTN